MRGLLAAMLCLTLASCGAESEADRVPALLEQLTSGDYATQIDAREALVGLGTSALPGLERALRDGGDDTRIAVLHLLARIEGEAPRRVASIRARLSDGSEPVREAAADALHRMGPDGMQALVDALREDDDVAATTAAQYVMYVAEEAGPWLEQLVEALEDPRIRLYVLRTIRDLGPRAASAVPAVARLLAGSDESVHHDAANALAELGPAVASAQDTLFARMDSPHQQVRIFVGKALGQLGASAVPRLREALRNGSEPAQETAARALRHLGAEGAAAVPELVDRLERGSAEVQEVAAEALGAMGAAAREALPALDSVRKAAGASGNLSLEVTAGIAAKLIREAAKPEPPPR